MSLAATITCSGTLIIGEGEQSSAADSGADSAVVSTGGHASGGWGGTADAAADTASHDSAAGAGGAGGATAGAGAGGAGGASIEAGEASAGSGGIPNPGPLACGHGLCAEPADCCYLNASCFNPATEADACPSPPDDGGEGKPCGANSHCASDEYCRNTNNYSCVGPGRCTRRDVASCNKFALDNETCACDGITRPERESCKKGVRAVSAWANKCGESVWFGDKVVVYCGSDSSWCPDGTVCCGITGYCYDPALKDLCVVPPAWAILPCISDADCPPNHGFCQGTTCGAPGGCKPIAPTCDGGLDPVCGCNGKTYMNDVCASNDRVATDYAGWCPDSGL